MGADELGSERSFVAVSFLVGREVGVRSGYDLIGAAGAIVEHFRWMVLGRAMDLKSPDAGDKRLWFGRL